MSSKQTEDATLPLPTTSGSILTGSYNSSKKRNHPFLISGLFDVFGQVRPFFLISIYLQLKSMYITDRE